MSTVTIILGPSAVAPRDISGALRNRLTFQDDAATDGIGDVESQSPPNQHRHLRKRNRAKLQQTRLDRRNDESGEDAAFKARAKKANQYHNKYYGSANRAKRERLAAGDGSPEELAEYQDLHAAYTEHEMARRKAARRPGAQRPDVSQYTPKQVKALHEQFKIMCRKYHTTPEGGAEFRRLSAAVKQLKADLAKRTQQPHGRLEELAKLAKLDTDVPALRELIDFEQVHYDYKEYVRWRHWDRTRKAGDYSEEELAQLDTHRAGYRIWRNEFIGPKRRALREALRAQGDRTAEGRRFQEAHADHKAYSKVISRHKRLYGKFEIQFTPEDMDDVRRLEELRDLRNEYVRDFGGAKNQARKAQMEAEWGPPEELKRYERLQTASAEFLRIYHRIYKRMEKRVEAMEDYDDDDDDQQPSPPADNDVQETDEMVSLGTIGSGRPRWFVRMLQLMRDRERQGARDQPDDDPDGNNVDKLQAVQIDAAKQGDDIVGGVVHAGRRVVDGVVRAISVASNDGAVANRAAAGSAMSPLRAPRLGGGFPAAAAAGF